MKNYEAVKNRPASTRVVSGVAPYPIAEPAYPLDFGTTTRSKKRLASYFILLLKLSFRLSFSSFTGVSQTTEEKMNNPNKSIQSLATLIGKFRFATRPLCWH